jgi:4-amino-4-deoxy-L-arabinose transferase-like glycosyltransferase
MSLHTRRSFACGLLGALALGAVLRVVWLTADPPTHATVGIVWHDEGPWVHNARNRVLWDTWRTDNWNPVFISPVFTGLEFIAFSTLGVGTWQARTVPVVSGLASVLLLALGLAATAGRRAGLIAAVLLAPNYVFVMWNRAALMESTMTAFIVASWTAYALAERRPAFGLLSGVSVVLAWFTKASAAFFVAALLLDIGITLAFAALPLLRDRLRVSKPAHAHVAAARWTLAGLIAAAAIVGLLFVLPNWSDYWFYNWQMSVARKPSYSLRALVDRASWLPIAHDFFTRMWLVTVSAALAMVAVVARWRSSAPAKRLLVFWMILGLAELVVHDTGNERRYVMFIPALVGLAALVLAHDEPIMPPVGELDLGTRFLLVPLVLVLSYLVFGAVARLPFLYEIRPGVRLSVGLAVAALILILWRFKAVLDWLARQRVTAPAAMLIVGLAVASDAAQYWQWTRHRSFKNYQASVALRELLAPGTLVHGKLANGLSLENQIRPVFVGQGFGNYEDRKRRDDVRYILTYISPSLGYESQRGNPVILDVLDAYPHRTIVTTLDVAETSTGRDRAALFDKFGGTPPRADRSSRAQN